MQRKRIKKLICKNKYNQKKTANKIIKNRLAKHNLFNNKKT